MLDGQQLPDVVTEFGRRCHEAGLNSCPFFYRIRDWVKNLGNLPNDLNTVCWLLDLAEQIDGDDPPPLDLKATERSAGPP